MHIRPRRSMLYMPGSNERALDKAKTLPVDGVIFDLEDSVAPARKAFARELAGARLRAGGYGPRELIVRVNALSSEWGMDDLAAICAAGPDAILLPKVDSAADVLAASRAMDAAGAPATTRLWVMMETPLAVLNAHSIAQSAREPGCRLAAFVLGANDLAKETRARLTPGRGPLLGWLSQCVLAARAHGLDVIDSVFNEIADEAGFRAECLQGLDMGMDGKSLIHPSQVDACNDVFAPSPDEVAWARRVIAAFEAPENAGKGAIALDGRMVERLHAVMAQRVAALAQAIEARKAPST